MLLEKYLLALCAATLLYTWAGYPLLLSALRVLTEPKRNASASEPFFSIVIAVHNEAGQIAAKLRDCFALDYPSQRVEVLVASDNSDDATDEIVKSFECDGRQAALVRAAARTGKSGAQNIAAANASGDILLFTDAGTRMHPRVLRDIARHFIEPSVGLVAPVVGFRSFSTAVSKGQAAYWDFETRLRQMESDLGVLATCSGAAFAVRRSLFKPIPQQYGDDCVLPLDVKLQNYQVVQAPEALVSDEMPHTTRGELRARIRMTARNFAGTLSRAALLNPVRYPGAAWALISHKLLRWLTPFFALGLFLSNLLLALDRKFMALFAAQCCFYLAGIIGCIISGRRLCSPVFAYPFAFCVANAGFLMGSIMCLRGVRITAYK